MDQDHDLPEGLDRIDLRILRVLQDDARITHQKLAEAVHLSASSVHERVKRLQRDGFILGYRAQLNPDKLGAALMVFVGPLVRASLRGHAWGVGHRGGIVAVVVSGGAHTITPTAHFT
ncbi:MAG: Lrp/AsnC family transcriptional regulator, partial [Inhella sp.]